MVSKNPVMKSARREKILRHTAQHGRARTQDGVLDRAADDNHASQPFFEGHGRDSPGEVEVALVE